MALTLAALTSWLCRLLGAPRRVQRIPTCYALLPGGQWAIERVQPDRTRQVIATVAKPAFGPTR